VIVYLALNTANGRGYVGQTRRDLSVRIKEHARHCRRKDRPLSYFHKAVLKHGVEAFQWVVLAETASDKALDVSERAWIESLGTMVPDGYNLETGGNRNKRHSEESKARISASLTGHVMSEESKARVSLTKKGKRYPKRTAEHERKLSECKRGENNPSAKLSNDDVKQILVLIDEGKLTQPQIGAMFGVGGSAISAIKCKRRRNAN
jgi:group I intron endonuclease